MDKLIESFNLVITDIIKDDNLDDETSELIVDRLLSRGANVNYQESDGNTILMLSIMHKKTDTFDTILKYKPDLTKENNNGEQAIHIASIYGTYYLDKLINEGVNIDTPDKVYNRPINYAILSSNIDCIALLIDEGATLNLLNEYGASIYDIALSINDTLLDFINEYINKSKKKKKRMLKKIKKENK